MGILTLMPHTGTAEGSLNVKQRIPCPTRGPKISAPQLGSEGFILLAVPARLFWGGVFVVVVFVWLFLLLFGFGCFCRCGGFFFFLILAFWLRYTCQKVYCRSDGIGDLGLFTSDTVFVPPSCYCSVPARLLLTARPGVLFTYSHCLTQLTFT